MCILVCYLALLALEMALLLYRRPAETAAKKVGPMP
jgi:hypothetical protein